MQFTHADQQPSADRPAQPPTPPPTRPSLPPPPPPTERAGTPIREIIRGWPARSPWLDYRWGPQTAQGHWRPTRRYLGNEANLRRWLENRFDLPPQERPRRLPPSDGFGIPELFDSGRLGESADVTPPQSTTTTPDQSPVRNSPGSSLEAVQQLSQQSKQEGAPDVLGWIVSIPGNVAAWVSDRVKEIFTGTQIDKEFEVPPPADVESSKEEDVVRKEGWDKSGGGLKFFLEEAKSEWQRLVREIPKLPDQVKQEVSGKRFYMGQEMEGESPWTTPLGSFALAIPAAALQVGQFLLSAPAKLAEYGIAELLYGHERAAWGVDTPEKERAFSASLGIAYSGPIRRRALYEAILREGKDVSTERIKQLQEAFGDPVKEGIGQAGLDPWNFIDLVIKPLFKGAEVVMTAQRMASPLLEGAKLGKPFRPVSEVLDRIASTREVLEELQALSTLRGQLKQASGPLDRAVTLLFPRVRDAVAQRVGQEATQTLGLMSGVVKNQVISNLRLDNELAKLLAEGAEEAQNVFRKRFADAIGYVAENLVKTASDDINEVRAALQALDQIGLGSLAASRPGRRLGVLLKRIITDEEGNVGDLTKLLRLGQQADPIEVADRWASKLYATLNELLPVPWWERGVSPVSLARKVIKKRAPLDSFFAQAFMGTNPGYAIRNMIDNINKIMLEGYSPFTRVSGLSEIEQRLGTRILAAHRGIGAAEVSETRPGVTTLFLWLGQKGEKLASEVIVEQAFRRAFKDLWGRAVVEIRASMPKEIMDVFRNDPQAMKWLEGRLARAGSMGPGWAQVLQSEIRDYLRKRGVVVSDDALQLGWAPWRQIPPELEETLRDAGMHDLTAALEIAAQFSQTPEEYIKSLSAIKSQLLQHMKHVLDSHPAVVPPSPGTAAGEISNAVETASAHALGFGKLDEAVVAKELDQIERYIAEQVKRIDELNARAMVKTATLAQRDRIIAQDVLNRLQRRYTESINQARSAVQKTLSEYLAKEAPKTAEEAAERLHDFITEVRGILNSTVDHSLKAFESEYLMNTAGLSGLDTTIDFIEKADEEWLLGLAIRTEAYQGGLIVAWSRRGVTDLDRLAYPNSRAFHAYVQSMFGKAYSKLSVQEKLQLLNTLREANTPGVAPFESVEAVRQSILARVAAAEKPLPEGWRVEITIPNYMELTHEQFTGTKPLTQGAGHVTQAAYLKKSAVVGYSGLSEMNQGRAELISFYVGSSRADFNYRGESPAELADILTEAFRLDRDWRTAILEAGDKHVVVVTPHAVHRRDYINMVSKALADAKLPPDTIVEWYARTDPFNKRYQLMRTTVKDFLEGRAGSFVHVPMVGGKAELVVSNDAVDIIHSQLEAAPQVTARVFAGDFG